MIAKADWPEIYWQLRAFSQRSKNLIKEKFGDIEMAKRRATDLFAKGFDVEVSMMTKTQIVYWCQKTVAGRAIPQIAPTIKNDKGMSE